jgi:hypothetical protein
MPKVTAECELPFGSFPALLLNKFGSSSYLTSLIKVFLTGCKKMIQEDVVIS